ncbi:DUF7551 domain-containing protein [Natrialbaceae archaeon A-gly3]
MIGSTLGDLREYIESLASDSGRYCLVCGRTGNRPVPADGLYFESRAIARTAGRATEQYRAVLRRYDPQLPYYDVIVCEKLPTVTSPGTPRVHADEEMGDRGGQSEAPLGREEVGEAIDFCHTVAGVVFEAIAASPHDDLEDAVMDTYLEAAETIESPDELCVQLLESIATELDTRLSPAEQVDVLTDAAASLPVDSDSREGREPLEDVLEELQSVALLESGHVDRCSIDLDSGASSWSVRLEGYAFGEPTGQIVTLPIVVGLLARSSTRSLSITDARRVEAAQPATWQLTIATTETDALHGLACINERECA